MSNLEHSRMVEDIAADFDGMLQKWDYGNARALIAGLKDSGFRSESEYLQKKLDAHIAEFTCEFCELDYDANHEKTCIVRQESEADNQD